MNYQSVKKQGSLSRQQTFNNEDVIIARSNIGTASQNKRPRVDSTTSRKSNNVGI